MSAGEQRKLELALRAEQAGEQCVEFRISAEGFDDVSRTACVVCRDERARLEIFGPTERTVGTRAEFVLVLANPTGRELPDVHVLLEHDAVLEPREASAGVRKSPGRLEWDLGMVRIDERVQIQVEFACTSVIERTCLRARVVGRDLEARAADVCLDVLPPRDIEIDVSDEQDPVLVGEKVRYQLRVTNRRPDAVSGLMLQFHPQGVQPIGVIVDGQDVLALSRFDAQTGVLSVPLPSPLRAETVQEITLQTTALHAGAGGLNATLTERTGALEISISEPTVVNAVPGSIAAGSP
jgi:hypothetical protein